MKKRLIIAVIFVLIAIAVFLIILFSNKQEEGVPILSGNVEVTEINIGFKISGRVVELFAEEGQRVKKGDRLAVLESSEIESQVAQNRAYLNEMITKLQELKSGSRPQEIEQAKVNLEYTEAELIKAKKDYERAEFLYKSGAISAQQMDMAKKLYDTALAQNKKAIETLSLVKEGPRKEQIRAQESRIKQAEFALNASEERFKDTVIYAPVSGIILRKNIEIGEIVSPNIPVYTIGDLENPWIKVYVKENKLGGVKVSVKNINDELKPGMPADVRIILR